MKDAVIARSGIAGTVLQPASRRRLLDAVLAPGLLALAQQAGSAKIEIASRALAVMRRGALTQINVENLGFSSQFGGAVKALLYSYTTKLRCCTVSSSIVAPNTKPPAPKS